MISNTNTPHQSHLNFGNSSSRARSHSLSSSVNAAKSLQQIMSKEPATLPELVDFEINKFKDYVFRRFHRSIINKSSANNNTYHDSHQNPQQQQQVGNPSSSFSLSGSLGALALASNTNNNNNTTTDANALDDVVDPPEVPRSFLRAIILAKFGPGTRMTADGVSVQPPTSSRGANNNTNNNNQTGNQHNNRSQSIVSSSFYTTAADINRRASQKHSDNATSVGGSVASSPRNVPLTGHPINTNNQNINTTNINNKSNVNNTTRSIAVRIQTPSQTMRNSRPSSSTIPGKGGSSTNYHHTVAARRSSNNTSNNNKNALPVASSASSAAALGNVNNNSIVSSVDNNVNNASYHLPPLALTKVSNNNSSMTSPAAAAPKPRVVLVSNRDKKPLQFFETQILLQSEWRNFIVDCYGQRPQDLGKRDVGGDDAHTLPTDVIGELDRMKDTEHFLLGLDITPHELDVILEGARQKAMSIYEKETAEARKQAEEEKKLMGFKEEREKQLQQQMAEAKKQMQLATEQQEKQANNETNSKGGKNVKNRPNSSDINKKNAAAPNKAASSSKKQNSKSSASNQREQQDHHQFDSNNNVLPLSSSNSATGQSSNLSSLFLNNNQNQQQQHGTSATNLGSSSVGGGTVTTSKRKLIKKHQAMIQRAFNLVSDAILAERDRRIAALKKTVPSSVEIRPDDDKANGIEKSKKFYGHRADKPYGKIKNYEDPREVQRSLHRHAFQVINDVADSTDSKSAMLNLRCLRDDYEGAKPGQPGWDEYCCLRYKMKSTGKLKELRR